MNLEVIALLFLIIGGLLFWLGIATLVVEALARRVRR